MTHFNKRRQFFYHRKLGVGDSRCALILNLQSPDAIHRSFVLVFVRLDFSTIWGSPAPIPNPKVVVEVKWTPILYSPPFYSRSISRPAPYRERCAVCVIMIHSRSLSNALVFSSCSSDARVDKIVFVCRAMRRVGLGRAQSSACISAFKPCAVP